MTLEEATVAFGKGFTYTRSFTHPYEWTRVGKLLVMRDAARNSGDYRVEEIVILGIAPEEAVAAIRDYAPKKFAISVLLHPDQPEGQIKDAYKAHGFRLLRREPMMILEPTAQAVPQTNYSLRRVLGQEDADAIARVTGHRAILPEDIHQGDAKLRLYAAFDDCRPVAWVRSVDSGPGIRWVSNMFVQEDHRRKGIARALMTHMLNEDHSFGAKWSVLLASQAGAQLYPHLGYRQIGLLQLFAPKKDRWP